MSRRKGFTLTELLVCIALLAVLLAFTLPVLGRVRLAALKTVCCSRLRDLTLACNAYRNDFEQYPKLGPGRDAPLSMLASLVNVPQPQELDAAFLNSLSKYLAIPAITPGTTAASDLPPMLQCPMVEDVEAARDSLLPMTFAHPSYYTGYAYVGRVDEQPPMPSGMRLELLRPERVATRKNASAVLWSDDVHWSMAGGGGWSYSHMARPVAPGPVSFTLDSPDGIEGQHRAYTDGQVEWVPADGMGLSLWSTLRDRGATIRIEPIFYSWY